LSVAAAAVAQVSSGRELPRTPVVSYRSAAEARAHSKAPSQYFQPLSAWTRQGGTYKTTFKVPFGWADRRVFLHVAGAGSGYTVAVNGKRAGHNNSAATPAEFDLTGLATEGVNNLEIEVSGEDILSPSASTQLGEAWIFSQPRVRIRDYVVNPLADAVELGVIVKSHLLNTKSVRVYYSLLNPDGSAGPYGHRDADFEMKLEDTVRFFIPLPEPRLWSHEMPYLYTLDLKLQHEGRFTEYVSYKVGLRTIGHRYGRLVVNGRPVALTAANTLHLHEPASDSVYTEADRRGLYAIGTADINTSRWGDSRTRGGNPSNDPRWEDDYTDRALTMYHTSKSHPSAAVFALAEASANGYNLYESYLAMKRTEPARPVIYPDGGEWNSDPLRLGEAAVMPRMGVEPVRDTVWMEGKREHRGKIFKLTNNFETASLHDVVADWKIGRKRGSVAVKGVIPAGGSREFVVDVSKIKPGPYSTEFSLFRPAEHFDPPASADKRGLIKLP
jgi:beta-galactosidase